MDRGSLFHRAYQATIAVKGLDGLIETIAGVIVAIAGQKRIYAFVLSLTAPEISGDPLSDTARLIRHGADGFMHASHVFVVTYLLVHGVLKLGIAISLLVEKGRWIFPVGSLVLVGFIAFMVHRLTVHWSLWLLSFAIFDCITLALVINEWRTVRQRQALKAVRA